MSRRCSQASMLQACAMQLMHLGWRSGCRETPCEGQHHWRSFKSHVNIGQKVALDAPQSLPQSYWAVPSAAARMHSPMHFSRELANEGVLAVQAGGRAETPDRVPGRHPAPPRRLRGPPGCAIQGRLLLVRSQQQMAGMSGGISTAWRLKARTLMMFGGTGSQLSHRQWTPTTAAWAYMGQRSTSSPASATHKRR